MKLALHLHKTLGELCRSMSSEELTYWQAYHQLFGLHQDRSEATLAMVGAALCRTWGSKVNPQDFIPLFSRPKVDEAKARELFRAWVDSHNRQVK